MLQLIAYCHLSPTLCLTFSFISLYALFILSLSLFNCYQIIRIYKRCTYQILIMLICALQALLNIVNYAFYYQNLLIISANYISIIQLAFIAQYFVVYYYKIKYKDRSK